MRSFEHVFESSASQAVSPSDLAVVSRTRSAVAGSSESFVP
jgi:hypothetical protein